MVDIIIPIYNAYEDLVKCIASIWRYTDLEENRLILVNDKSTDTRISPYLEGISGGNIIIYNNEKNEGFSASVNMGMQCSDRNDIVLLNSDTIVTKNWLKKIVACAYSDSGIATVTPLSNSATIASIPIIGQDNPIPYNVNIDQYADIVEMCSFKDYPQIAVAVGFCMYIKRKVIEEIGFFDAKTFGHGYGEENDFCCRAEMMGYKHVLCDDTFIYHKGTASFVGEQKKALVEEHVKILEQRYAKSMRNNHIFCMSKPFQYIRDNIGIYVQLFNEKNNILYVLHDDFRQDSSNSIGGTQLHVKDLCSHLRDKYNIYVLAKNEKKYHLSCYVNSEMYMFEFEDKNINSYQTFRDERQGDLLENILNAFRIDLIHVHHVSKISLEIYYIAKKLSIPIMTTVHDFYMLCPTYFLYNIHGENCRGHEDSLCQECLEQKAGICSTNMNYISKWRYEMRKGLENNNIIVFPSYSARQIFDSVYSMEVKEIVISHGLCGKSTIIQNIISNYVMDERKVNCNIEYINLIENNSIGGWAYVQGIDNRRVKVVVQIIQDNQVVYQVMARKEMRQDVDDCFGKSGRYLHSGFQTRIIKNIISGEIVSVRILLVDKDDVYVGKYLENISLKQDVVSEKIRVAFVGGLSDVKGCKIACEMIKKAPDIEWFIFGMIDYNEELSGLDLPNLHKFGAYNREEIGTLLHLNKIEAVCIMSKCSETFCYTLSEALEAKIPVLAYDIGAVGERLHETGVGILVSPEMQLELILDKLRDIREGKEWKDARENLKAYRHKTTEEMVEEYVHLYEHLLGSSSRHRGMWDAKMIKNAYCGSEKIFEV